MKLGFMTFIEPTWTLEEHMAAAQRHGYTGIEPRCEADHGHGIEIETGADGRSEIRSKIGEEGLEFCCIATSRKFVDADEKERQASVDKTKRYVELAADVGAPYVRVFGGSMPGGIAPQGVVQYAADALREVGEFAADYPVIVAVETHDDWCNTYHMAELIRRVDHAKIQVNWDYHHPMRHFEPVEESYARLRQWIVHTHMHDVKLTEGGMKAEVCALGEGYVPQKKVMELLDRDGYTGYFSLELIGLGKPDELLAQYAEKCNEYLAEIKGGQ